MLRFLIHNSRGQAGVGLVFLVAFMFLVFASGYLVFLDKNIKVSDNQLNIESKNMADRIAFEINNAANQGNGFAKNFSIPSAISGHTYTINVSDNFVILNVKGQSFLSKVIVSTINGTIVAGKNMAENIGGTIYVTRA